MLGEPLKSTSIQLQLPLVNIQSIFASAAEKRRTA